MPRLSRTLAPSALPESEKITINVGFVDLGTIDLLVREGFYANRTDFIRTAMRHHLARHDEAVASSARRKQLELGLVRFSRDDLEAVAASGEMLDVKVLGLAAFGDDVTPDLARRTIGSLRVLGALQAPAAVKAALADRMR